MSGIQIWEINDASDIGVEEKQPKTTQQEPNPTPVASRSNSNIKKQPQGQEKGKGKAPATKKYSQGYRIPNLQQDIMENSFHMTRTMI
ncbi:hypothetical protein O181_121773 [Austropuccinia psidii MF-1]|uniref:Uncharacterized protein n=1 Tax=Austropuccinia psidii MF-1 TaxID=1389203 RepID=A0A9Q3KI54_9BASI|nr:hypothetical protein [Austropuccinia psidii MF-1]